MNSRVCFALTNRNNSYNNSDTDSENDSTSDNSVLFALERVREYLGL